jgi:curved DNA-binding protein CbpA
MNELHNAYGALGLSPGTGIERIRTRYKRLVMVWHPDRMPTGKGKEDADEELRKINIAKDILEAHFGNGSHKTGNNCECEPLVAQAAASQDTTYSSGRTRSKTQFAEGGNQTDSDEERRRTAAQEKAQAEWEAKAKAKDSLRWGVSGIAGNIFAGLFVLSFLVTSVKGCFGTH